jgi:hypothetical protein
MKIVSTTLCNASSAKIVGDALRSVVDWVDECILIDTQNYSDAVNHQHLIVASDTVGAKLRVYPFEWCDDFAGARNFALLRANESGADWAVTLDADERMQLKGHKFDVTENFLRFDNHECYMVCHESIAYAKERFFKLPATHAWVGPIHEGFLAPQGEQWPALPPEIITFSELEKTPDEYKRKYTRDVLKLTEYVKVHPESRWFFFLGDAHQILATLSQGEERLNHLMKARHAHLACMKRNDWPEESAIAAFRAAQCAYEIGDYAMAINLCASGLTYHAALPELPFIAALASLKAGLNEQAMYWAHMALDMQPRYKERTSTRFLPAYYEGPWDVIRAVVFADNKYKDDVLDEVLEQYNQKKLARIQATAGKHDSVYSMPTLCGPWGTSDDKRIQP